MILHDILFEMVRNHKDKSLEDVYDQFEQIIYKKQKDFKAPTVDFDGTLKDLYTLITKELNLTYRPQQLYLSEIILEQLMNSEKAMIEAPLGRDESHLRIYSLL